VITVSVLWKAVVKVWPVILGGTTGGEYALKLNCGGGTYMWLAGVVVVVITGCVLTSVCFGRTESNALGWKTIGLK
jgi:hypothetical protein